MAEDLFAGQCVDGDQALCEAALSARCFFALTELGVPFPCTEQGEFMGYKTDHDRGRRATSAGPYTSRLMTEALEKAVKEKEIRILDKMQVIKLLTFEGRIKGVLCLDKKEKEEPSYVLIWCENVILATDVYKRQAWRLSLAFNISSTATSRPVMNWDESVFIRILPPDHGIGRF